MIRRGHVTLYREHLTIFVPYSFAPAFVGRNVVAGPDPEEPQPYEIDLQPPGWLELTDEERDDLELAVLEMEGARDD
jgi:hypothetical protein